MRRAKSSNSYTLVLLHIISEILLLDKVHFLLCFLMISISGEESFWWREESQNFKEIFTIVFHYYFFLQNW